jgi:mono/diheme cytochrome c family protein
MKRLSLLKPRLQAGFGLAAATAGILALSLALVDGADPKSPGETKPEKKTEKKVEKKQLTGAELYAIHCGRCHPERYPTEFTPTQWKTVMTEMRVRANLPAVQAKAILKYLQEDSGTP